MKLPGKISVPLEAVDFNNYDAIAAFLNDGLEALRAFSYVSPPESGTKAADFYLAYLEKSGKVTPEKIGTGIAAFLRDYRYNYEGELRNLAIGEYVKRLSNNIDAMVLK